MIKKIFISAAIAIGIMSSPALALEQFYHHEVGQWAIEGFTGEKNFCSAKTYWPTDSYMSLFNMKGSDELALYVHNSDWNISGDYGSYYQGKITFTGRAGYDDGGAPFELQDSQTIIFRNLTQEFLVNWVKYRNMKIVMPNDIPDITVGLVGTAAATEAYIDCIDHLNN